MNAHELSETYRSLKLRGAECVRAGRFEEAFQIYSEARGVVERIGDPELGYEAVANLSMVHLELGRTREAEAGLREIVLRSRNQDVVFGACYNLAVSLRKQGNHGRALAYASRAMEISRRRRAHPSRALVHNLLGNIYLGQSHLDPALKEYRRALAIRRREIGDNRFSVAILKENIGYCLLLKRQLRRGMKWITEALGLAEETGDRRCQADCLQDLAYAWMHAGNYEKAASNGAAALEAAIEGGYRDVEKNCYYLLGETAHLAGDGKTRDRWFNLLQTHYPDMPHLRDFLCAVDVSGMINLKA
jgi:tetratricopeptide (TPR) repeat protein